MNFGMSRRMLTGLAVAGLLATGTLVGCSTSGEAGRTDQENGPQSAVVAQSGVNPYAAEFAEAAARTENETARTILESGTITASQYAEIEQLELDCYAAHGLLDIERHPDGSGSHRQPEGMTDDEAGDIVYECGISSGAIEVLPLYRSIQENPTNRDWDEVTVECLIATGVVEPSFTVADLNTLFEALSPRLGAGGDMQQCASDPIGTMDALNN